MVVNLSALALLSPARYAWLHSIKEHPPMLGMRPFEVLLIFLAIVLLFGATRLP